MPEEGSGSRLRLGAQGERLAEAFLVRRGAQVLERNWRAPAGKRIAVPVRVEPKVYFAVERTFFVSFPSAISPPLPLPSNPLISKSTH